MKTYGWISIYLLLITVHEMNAKALQQPFNKRNAPAITNGILKGNLRKPRPSSRSARPSRPMSAGPEAAQEFTITHQARPNCLLMRSYFQDNKFLTYASAYATTFKVMKTENKLMSGEKQVIFFAIHGPNEFTKAAAKGFSKSHRYLGQVGWIQCKHGKLERVEVNDTPRNARRCGIASVLTELCFLDPDVYQKGDKSIAYKKLQEHGVETKCNKAVSLRMEANPKTGAYTYFSVATRLGYNKLIVNWPFPEFAKISVYDTADAKKSYDPNTGRIESQICCNNEKQCDAYDADWIFCEEQ